MVLDIENHGSGFIGEIGASWRVTQNSSPAIVGQGAGRLGGLTFNARCDSTSKFTIDNHLSVRHYFDGRVARWLSTFDVYVRGISTNGDFGNFSAVSALSALDVERTSSVDVAGTPQRAIRLPEKMPYVIGATTYYTGGSYQTIGGQQVWAARSIAIYDLAASENYTYVLAAGGHNGEVVFVMGLDGLVLSVWPVYSDATDLAGPGSRVITYSNNSVFIGQTVADRVKRFTYDGVFMLQFGSSGTGNGQFTLISGIAANDSGLDALYVVDKAQGRVQYFNKSGVYQNKWGTLGTGSGDFVFDNPTGVAVDPKTHRVFVADEKGRVREYGSTGTFYWSQPMGTYSFITSKSTGEYLIDQPISVGFDHLGNAYGAQRGRIYKYVRDNDDWINSPRGFIREWTSPTTLEPAPATPISVSRASGVIHMARAFDYIDQYAGSLGNLTAHLLYYIALAAFDFPLRLQALNKPWATGELNFPAWTGNVWDHVCQLCAATSNAIVAFEDRIVIMNREARVFTLPEDVIVDPVSIDSRGAGRSVEITNWRSRYTGDYQEVMYDAEVDNHRTINVNVNDYAYIVVRQNCYPEYLVDPEPATAVADGKYVVIDSDNLIVDPDAWTNYGGSITADLGDRPGDILLTVQGPRLRIPGYTAPFKIADVGEGPALRIMGAGVKVDPETLTVGTGLSEAITNQLVAQSIDSPFIWDATVAYSEASWAAYTAGTPSQQVRFTLPNISTPRWVSPSDVGVSGIGGTMQFVGAFIEHDDATYIVEDMDIGPDGIVLDCYRYTKAGWSVAAEGPALPEEIWSSKIAPEFDAYWAGAGFTAQDFTVAPLRNPFGA